jgi:hypothetical protein
MPKPRKRHTAGSLSEREQLIADYLRGDLYARFYWLIAEAPTPDELAAALADQGTIIEIDMGTETFQQQLEAFRRFLKGE